MYINRVHCMPTQCNNIKFMIKRFKTISWNSPETTLQLYIYLYDVVQLVQIDIQPVSMFGIMIFIFMGYLYEGSVAYVYLFFSIHHAGIIIIIMFLTFTIHMFCLSSDRHVRQKYLHYIKVPALFWNNNTKNHYSFKVKYQQYIILHQFPFLIICFTQWQS